MQGVYSVEQIRAAEARAMAALPDGALMTRAATGLANACARQLRSGRPGRVYGSRVGLLIGSGNNGGDALYAGTQLIARGVAVTAVLLDREHFHRGGANEFYGAGGQIIDADAAADRLVGCDLIVDGIVGIGGRGGLKPLAWSVVDAIRDIPMLAVDIPSGVDADTGAVEGDAVSAHITITFGGIKTGLVTGEGAVHTGELHLVDIGLDLPAPTARILEEPDVAALLRLPGEADDKYTRGVVGVIAGSSQYPGAGMLATGAARRGGAGMVRYLGGAPEQVKLRYPDVVVHEHAVPKEVRVQAWVVGPGLGIFESSRRRLREALATDVPVLVDADGITMLAEERSLLQHRGAPTLITPHDREFERIAGPVGDDRLGAARRAAVDLGVTVLLKGNRTVVASPDGTALVNPTGTPWLGTAGTGDVLAGFAGAVLASGLDPAHAAAVAAYLHGLAGQLAGRLGNPDAQDVLACLPRAVAAVRG